MLSNIFKMPQLLEMPCSIFKLPISRRQAFVIFDGDTEHLFLTPCNDPTCFRKVWFLTGSMLGGQKYIGL